MLGENGDGWSLRSGKKNMMVMIGMVSSGLIENPLNLKVLPFLVLR